jgi:hypothetical protein
MWERAEQTLVLVTMSMSLTLNKKARCAGAGVLAVIRKQSHLPQKPIPCLFSESAPRNNTKIQLNSALGDPLKKIPSVFLGVFELLTRGSPRRCS